MQTFTFNYLADAFIQSNLQLRTKASESSRRGKNNARRAQNTKFSHCSE